MADYWDMMAQQESGLDATDLGAWDGDAFTLDGGGLTDLGKGLLNQNQFYEMNGMAGMTSLPATSGVTQAQMEAQQNDFAEPTMFGSTTLVKAFEPIKNAMSTTDSFLRTLMDDKTLGLVYGSAIMAGAQGIMSYLNNEKSMEYQTQLTQSKYAEDAKVRQEGYAREDDKRARQGVVAGQGKVTPKPNAMTNYQAPGYAVSKQYDDIANKNRYGLLGG